MIVKLASIELTPQKPVYDGGSWHVEGMGDEGIVATAIYYVSSENITTAHLRFRTTCEEPYDYEQGDREGVAEVYGIGDDDAAVQELGSCTTGSGRALAWPNSLQHKVESFELADKSKPGRREILVYFLVDPAARRTSTADVPPQQSEWLHMELRMMPRFRRLPEAILERIVHLVGQAGGHYLGFATAAKRREALMHERKFFVRECNEKQFVRPWSLCEH